MNDLPTREQVLQEPAGEQLQTWLAELVLGWELEGSRAGYWTLYKSYRWGRFNGVRFANEIPRCDEWRSILWVQEAMHARGYRMRLLSPWDMQDDQWRAGFTPHGTSGFNNRPDHEVGDVNPATATVKAALWTILEEREAQEQAFQHEIATRDLEYCDVCRRSEIDPIIDKTGQELLVMERDDNGDMLCEDCKRKEQENA